MISKIVINGNEVTRLDNEKIVKVKEISTRYTYANNELVVESTELSEQNHARYTELDGTKAINCVNEKLLLNSSGYHEKKPDGSVYKFIGKTETKVETTVAKNFITLTKYKNLVRNTGLITNVTDVGYSACETYFEIEPNVTYQTYFRPPYNTMNFLVIFYDENKENIGFWGKTTYANDKDANVNFSFSTNNSSARYVRFGANGSKSNTLIFNGDTNSDCLAIVMNTSVETKTKVGYKRENVQLSFEYTNVSAISAPVYTIGSNTLSLNIKSGLCSFKLPKLELNKDYTLAVRSKTTNTENSMIKISNLQSSLSDEGFETLSPNGIKIYKFLNNDVENRYLYFKYIGTQDFEFCLLDFEYDTFVDLDMDCYYVKLGNHLLNIGQNQLGDGDSYSTDGLRKNADGSVEIMQSQRYDEGLLGADLETPRYKLDYNYVESIECKSENLIDRDNPISTYNSNAFMLIKNETYSYLSPRVKIIIRNVNGTSLKQFNTRTFVWDLDSGFYCCTFYDEDNVAMPVDKNNNCVLVKGSIVPTQFVPYYNQSKQLNLAILNNGSIVNNKISNEYAIVNAWECNIDYNSTGKFFDIKGIVGGDHRTDREQVILCNAYNTIAWVDRSQSKDLDMYAGFDINIIRFKDLRFDNINDLKQYLQANNVKIIYKLANPISNVPIETPSTPTAIECNVNADSKGVSIKYAKQL